MYEMFTSYEKHLKRNNSHELSMIFLIIYRLCKVNFKSLLYLLGITLKAVLK